MSIIAHIWALATDIVRIDLKRSVSISTCEFTAMIVYVAHNWAIATDVVEIDLKQFSFSTCALLFIAMFIAHIWSLCYRCSKN